MPAQDRSSYMVRREDQLAALLDVRHGTHLLAQFLAPRTASEAARALGEPANRVAYHVRRLCRLGLLVGAGARGKRPLYRAVAEDFTLSTELWRGLDAERGIKPLLDALVETYLSAAHTTPPEPTEAPFVRLGADLPAEPDPGVAFAAGLNMRILRLTPTRFRELNDLLRKVVQEAEQSERGAAGARTCTVAVMAFPGSVLPMSEEAGRDVDIQFKEA